MLRLSLIFLLAVITLSARAQSDIKPSSLGEKNIILQQVPDSLFLDSLALVPASLKVTIQDKPVNPERYHYDYSNGYLYFSTELGLSQPPLKITYRSLSFSFNTSYAHKSLSLYDSTAFFREKKFAGKRNTSSGEELFATPKLSKQGSISRGISVGNRNSVFVNSSLNLQLEGALTDDLQIRASITDQNIPVQPEGNAQQLQDFDNVLLELYNQQFSLMAGDVVFQQSGTPWKGNSRSGSKLYTDTEGPYFLRYRRNVQGARLKWEQQNAKKTKSETTAGFALARGKFASLELEIQEGVQGPYQIQAAGNRTLGGGNGRQLGAFFIIANSEKVYLDGKLLERGFDRDYTIDYNLGEITFTSAVLLTRFSRVYVDFEYADRQYSRNIFQLSHQQHFKHLRVYADYFREGDNPNQSLDFSLSDNDKWLLSEAGDAQHHLLISSVDSEQNMPQQMEIQTGQQADVPGVGNLYRVHYNRKDTLVAGHTYEIYEFTDGEGMYTIDFHFLGEGQGDYVVSGSSVNSKVYQWVAPVNGVSQGSYVPQRPVVTPKRQQMLVLGSEARLSHYDHLTAELAISENDLNVLSDLDASDDRGQAFTLRYRAENRKINNTPWRISQNASYEFRQHNFTEIDPYRSIEFERDWFIRPYQAGDSSRALNDHIFSAGIHAKKDQDNAFQYQWLGKRQADYQIGQQHRFNWQKSVGMLQVQGDAFILRNQLNDQFANWKRLNADIFLQNNFVKPGYAFQLDKNQLSQAESDSVSFTSMNFEQHQFYLQSGDSLHGTFRLDYSLRRDFLPAEGLLRASDLARTLRATADLKMLRNQHIQLQLAYRTLDFLNDSLFTSQRPALEQMQSNTLLGQLHWNTTMANGAIRSDLQYNLGNGREPRREFVYVRVPVGEGAYTWRDDNNNGIEEIEEFYEARYFDEKNYVRVFVPGHDFILAYTNSLNYQLKIQPLTSWLDKQGIRSILGRFSSITSWDISKRITDQGLAERTLPFVKVQDDQLLSVRENLRSTLFFNRRQTAFGADLGMRRIHRRQLLNRGFEERRRAAYLLNLRWNLNRHWGVRWKAESGQEIQLLDMHAQAANQGRRDFRIHYYQILPELSWQPSMNTRIATHYNFVNRQNLGHAASEANAEKAIQHIIGLELRASKMMRHNLQAHLEYVSIKYNGEENAAIAYEMLDGLRNGSNLRWSVNWQQHLLDGLQLAINYFGRKSEQSSAVHSGSIMLRALL